MARQRQVRQPTSAPAIEKPKTRMKDTPELVRQLLSKYTSISAGIGDLTDLAEEGSKYASQILKLYATLVDDLDEFTSLVKRLRTRVFKSVFEQDVIEFRESLANLVQQAVNTMDSESNPPPHM
jgi:ferritin